MSRLHLPNRVRQEIEQDKWVKRRAEQRAALPHLFDFNDPVCRDWQTELSKLDQHLRLGRAKPAAYHPDFDIRCGFYHWVRDNPTAPPTVTPITGPDGKSFQEPDGRVLEDLKRNDLQNPKVFAALLARRYLDEQRIEREEQEQRVLRREEIMERAAAAGRTQVSMNRDVPWAQNATGFRRTKGMKSQSPRGDQ